MNDNENKLVDPVKLSMIRTAFQSGFADASESLAKWLDRPASVRVGGLELLPLEQACDALEKMSEFQPDQTVAYCVCAVQGVLNGRIILAFDDDSGLALSDFLLGQETGSATEWSEIAQSAAMETTNILCCSFFNSLIAKLPEQDSTDRSLLPTPPEFGREYAESLFEFLLMEQATESDELLLGQTLFEIDGNPFQWSLVFIPDSRSLTRLSNAT